MKGEMSMRLLVGCLVVLGLLLSGAAFAATTAAVPAYHVVKTIAVGGDGGWDCLTLDASTHRLYVARSSRVQVVDVEKGALVGEIANTPGVHGVAIVSALHRGFTSNGGDNTVSVFDTETLKEVDRVKVGERPDVIIFDRGTNRVFTFNGGSNDATAIDAATAKVVGTVALGGKPEFAVTSRGGLIYVNIEDKSEIVSFDPKTLEVKNRWPLAPGEGPSGLAMDGQHRRLFAACSNQKMVVMDADSGHVVTTVPIGQGVDGAGFDGDPGLAFSPNGRDGTLTVIQEQTPDTYAVVQTVPTQVSARTMAMDRRAHTIYLAAARFLPQPADDSSTTRRRPSIEPNSFVILVVGR
jgi:YVTN family beta-propeller protein